jgi:magnesium chelatase subunit I
VGGATIARELIRRAADATFEARAGGANTDALVMYFDTGSALQVSDDAIAAAALEGFRTVPGLLELVHGVGLADACDPAETVAACELVLEALVARRQISRTEGGEYGRAVPEARRRPKNDLYGEGFA